MPIARRRRPSSPDQPEHNHLLPDQLENAADLFVTEIPGEPFQDAGNQTLYNQPGQAPMMPPRAENAHYSPYINSSHAPSYPPAPASPSLPTHYVPPTPLINGERADRPDYPAAPGYEGSRRPPFRRPMPPSVAQPPSPFVPVAPQGPVHELNLPLGNLLHLAYNPGYTGAEEARRTLLEQLEQESKTGGRARCWNCGSLSVAYARWDTQSKPFGNVGVAYCEICGVWSVL